MSCSTDSKIFLTENIMKLIQLLWRTAWRFLKKQGIKPPYDPAIPLLGIYPQETKTEKGTCASVFIAALFTIDTDMEAT